MSNGFLRVEGEKVVDGNGNSVILRGAGLGGWMNMENFMYFTHTSTQHQLANLPKVQDTQVMNTNIELQC